MLLLSGRQIPWHGLLVPKLMRYELAWVIERETELPSQSSLQILKKILQTLDSH